METKIEETEKRILDSIKHIEKTNKKILESNQNKTF